MIADAETIKRLVEIGEYEFSHCEVDEDKCNEDTVYIDAYFIKQLPVNNINIEFKTTIYE